MRNFLSKARDLMKGTRPGLAQPERERFERVFEYRFELVGRARNLMRADYENIEDLFGLVDLQCRLGVSHAPAVREDLIFLITKTLSCTTDLADGASLILKPDNPGYFDGNRPAYRDFAGLVTGRRWDGRWVNARPDAPDVAVLTFNYDLVAESAMVGVGIRPDYGFDHASPLDGPASRVLKLHGSVNWFGCPECADDRVIVQWQNREPSCDRHPGTKPSTLIVPPTWDKGAGKSWLNQVWQSAGRELSSADRWIIIGYSAPRSDRFFRDLLVSAAAENRRLESVLVVDSSNPALNKFERLFAPSVERTFTRAPYPFPDANALTDIANVLRVEFTRERVK